jgi:hypothetical protein
MTKTTSIGPPSPPHSITRARLVERKLELWSWCYGVGVEARAPTRLTRPRLGKMLTFFCFFFVFLLFEEASKLRSFSGAPEAPCCNAANSGELLSLLLGQQALSSGELRSLLLGQQAPELVARPTSSELRSLLLSQQAPSSGACYSASKFRSLLLGQQAPSAPESSWACCSASKLQAPSSRAPSSERAPKLRESFQRAPESSERAPKKLRESSRAPRELESSELQRAPEPVVRPASSELLRSFGGCPEVAFVPTQQALELRRSSESSLLQRYERRSSGVCLPLQTKETQKQKTKKSKHLTWSWACGSRGRSSFCSNSTVIAPQQQLHSISSTATTPQLKLPLHKSSSGDGVRGGWWPCWSCFGHF